MARTRFQSDSGLTARMTATMFLLGALFVAIVVAVAAYSPGLGVIVGLAGIGIGLFQWWRSDTVALRAMRARVVTPEQAPELHGMIDRLCAMADMPKPTVAIADSPIPNAFATGRSPQRSAVCVTTGILQTLNAEELEGVLAHELSHVAHRDVLVMTAAASAGIVAGMTLQGAQFGALGRNRDSGGAPAVLVAILVSVVVYAVSFIALRLLSRYRELCADRSGAYLTQKPGALASALQKISGQMNNVPERDLRASQSMNPFFIAPAIKGTSLSTLTSTHPSLEQRLDQLAKIQAELGKAY